MEYLTLFGKVKRFSGKGRELGYPTANIEIDPATPEGLFIGYTYLDGKKLPSLIFIGVPTTVGGTAKRAESYILNFPDKDLYGKRIRLEAIKKLRDNRKFASVAKLVEQMRRDEQAARRYFQAHR